MSEGESNPGRTPFDTTEGNEDIMQSSRRTMEQISQIKEENSIDRDDFN